MFKITVFVSVILFFLTSFSLAQQDQITNHTYYPSPSGVYNTLRLYPTDGIEPTSNCANQGEMYYDLSDSQAYVCDGTNWQPLGGWGSGGISYTYYCYLGTWGTPLCPASVTIGEQGPCDAGFTVQRELGSWGDCNNCNKPSGLGNVFLAPGGSCGGNCAGPNITLGQAYVCSQ